MKIIPIIFFILFVPELVSAQSNPSFNDCQLKFNTQQLSGEVKLAELKNAKSIILDPDLNLMIRSFELTIQETKENPLVTFKCSGETLDSEIQEYLHNLNTVRRVLFEHIIAEDSSGKRHHLEACQLIVRE